MKRLIYLLPVFALLAFGGLVTQTVNAQNSFATWQGAFYNNAQLINPPVYEATFNEINFDWGSGSPNSAVNADDFSARFGTDTFFEAGTYRFSITVDDGVQLLVDNNAVLNTYNTPHPGDTQTVDVTLTEGSHHLQVDYREIAGNALLKMSWINVNDIPSQPTGGAWTAQYYSNPTFSGTPFLTRTEANAPSYRYGLGAPLNGMPADNFSVRWSTTQNLPAGNYGIQVYADDGVRVFVNGVAYINEFHTFTGQGYTANFNLVGGATNIVVEYFESGFNAEIDFRLITPTGTVNPSPTTAPTGATATVTAGVLNVRSLPSTNGDILTKIRRNETYSITGTNSARTWYRLDVAGISGWVSSLFVTTSNAANIPVVDEAPVAQPTLSTSASQTAVPSQFTAITVANLNLRAEPNTTADSLLVIPRGGEAAVLARNSDSTWLKLNYQGVVGWSSARFLTVNPPLILENVPVE
jgi:uncharacterized protein YraI